MNEPGSLYCYKCGLPLDEQAPMYTHSAPGAFSLGRPAGFWIRLAAMLIDGVLITIVVATLAALFFGDNYLATIASEEATYTSSDVLLNVLDLAYSVIGIGVWGATVGKFLLKMRVVRSDGSKVGLGRALARYLSYILSALIFGIGFLMIAFRHDKRGLHDLICDTVVVIRY